MSAPPQALHVVVAREVDTTTITLQGDLDLASRPTLVSTIDQLRPLPGPLILDVGGVEFIDSTGLRTLLSASDAARADTDTAATLTRCTPATLHLLEISGVEHAFTVEA